MLRGHILESDTFTAATQEGILIAAGVQKRAIYRNDLSSALRSLRTGDRLVVATLRGLGRSREKIEAAIEAVHKRNALVMDAESDRTTASIKARKALTEEAVALLANERRGPRKNRHKGRMPWDQIQLHWIDVTKTNAEVMALVNAGRKRHISLTTVWRKLGKRNKVSGRPSKK